MVVKSSTLNALKYKDGDNNRSVDLGKQPLGTAKVYMEGLFYTAPSTDASDAAPTDEL